MKYMVTCATMESNFGATRTLAREYNSILPCYGIHPWFLDSLSEKWEQTLGDWVSAQACGLGETGLDFMDRGGDRDLQIRVFKAHLTLANDLKRPVNIHVRKAWDALIRILKQTGPLKAPGLIHSYSGSADLVGLLEKYNLFISFSGSVTRPNAKKTIKAVRAVSRDRVLLETDAPDIFPSLDGEKRKWAFLNEPANLVPIGRVAAQKRGMDEKDFLESAWANSLRVFGPVLGGKRLVNE